MSPYFFSLKKRTLLGFFGIALFAVCAAFLSLTEDPLYHIEENLPWSKFHRYDTLISAAAKKNDIDPSLVKAVIWQESKFNPSATGKAGERGLMQVTEIASKDWVKQEKIESFQPSDLFDPKTNIDAGTWYLARSLRRYETKDDPRPFALAEYNAGASRVVRWTASTDKEASPKNARSFLGKVDFPKTLRYVESIIWRHDFYLKRNEFPLASPDSPATPPSQ